MSCEIKRILQLEQPLKFQEIRLIDESGNDITLTSMYAWSSDGCCFTNWATYDVYKSICPNMGDFFLRILLFGSLDKVYVGGLLTTCYSLTFDTSNQFLINFCDNPNLFNPYVGLDCALLLQQQMADSVICMFGIPIYYFRVVPQKDTADYTFKEYVMHNVESIKQLKLMIPDGMMPSSKPQFSDMDFDWEVDWDVELGKNQFATAFGDTAFPKNGDFIYIPLMKRMWNVNSAYDEKNENLMWQSTTWKLGLVKYNGSTNVITDGFDDIIDNWVTNKYENVFGELERNEQERVSAAPQIETPSHSGNSNGEDVYMEDAIRKSMTKSSIRIIDKQYNNKSVIVAKNLYKFYNPSSQVTYQKGICGPEGTLSFIIETPGSFEGIQEILSFGNIRVSMEGLTISFENMKQELKAFNSYMVILSWSHSNYSVQMSIYEYTHNPNVKAYMLRPEMYYFDFENPVCEQVVKYNNDLNQCKQQLCTISGGGFNMTNIKLFNRALDKETSIKESCKYTTTNEMCVINDVARPLTTGNGFSVR